MNENEPKIKRPYSKKKFDSDENPEVKPSNSEVAPREVKLVVSFKAFFDRMVGLGKYQAYQEREFEAYCKDKKLKSKETEETFLSTLESY